MEESIPHQLKEAADLIKDGQIAAARNILVPLLRIDDQIEEAWYLLSFTLANTEKREYALTQALKINPVFERAQDRLDALSKGQIADIPASEETEEGEEESAAPWELSSKTKPLPELAALEAEPLDALEDLADLQNESEFTAPFYESTFEEDEEETEEKEKKENEPKRRGSIRRRLIIAILFFLIVLLLIVGGGNLLPAIPVTESTLAPVETLPPTPQGFRTLPPTWTPQIEESESGLLEPSGTPFPGAALQEIDENRLIRLEEIQEQIADLRGLEILPFDDIFFTSQDQLLEILDEIYGGPQAVQEISSLASLYERLSLLPPDFPLREPYLLTKIDAPGTYYDADFDRIFLFGDLFNLDVAYAFAFSYAQALLDFQFDTRAKLSSLDCSQSIDQCLALESFLKAEARLLADQWLLQFAPDDFPNSDEFDPSALFARSADDLPLFLQNRISFIDQASLAFAQELFLEEGWGPFDEIDFNQSFSTYEILYQEISPEESNVNFRSSADLEEELASGYELTSTAQLGPWLLSQWLSANVKGNVQVSEAEAIAALSAWQDDVLHIFEFEDQYMLIFQISWQSAAGQSDFEMLFDLYMDDAFEIVEEDVQGAVCRSSSNQRICMSSLDLQSLLLLSSNP